MGREFHTAAKKKQEADGGDELQPFEFLIDDEPYTVNPPDTTQIVLFQSAFQATDVQEADKIQELKEFTRSIFDAAGYRAIMERVRDKKDPFDLVVLMQVIFAIIEEVTDFPTEESSDSTTARKPTGARSTGRAPGKNSTRSTSPRGGSTT